MKKPFIRVCIWDRQTGKSSFIINDVLEMNCPLSKILIVNSAGSLRIRKALTRKKGEKYLANIGCGENELYIANSDEEVTFIPAYKLKSLKCDSFYGKQFDYIYLEEPNEFTISFEQLMISLDKFQPKIITFIGTQFAKPTIMDRALLLIKNPSEMANLMNNNELPTPF